MNLSFDFDALLSACRQHPSLAGLTRDEFLLLKRKGTSNDHVRLGASGLVARIPRFSHSGFDAETNLTYQAAAFTRAAPSGHTPHLFAVLPIARGLPAGALLVDHIEGQAPSLPDAMPAIASALAALHGLPVPPPAEREPLTRAVDPVTATLEAIELHAVCLPDAGLDRRTIAALEDDLEWARRYNKADSVSLPPRLVGADTHPGNFLTDSAGKAWFVDLEKLQYGSVAIDLAHASLPTSTGWDPDVTGTLTARDIDDFQSCYLALAEPAFAALVEPSLLPMRRLTWLRTMTFFARWRADWSRNPKTGDRDPDMDRHIDRHIDRCFAPETVITMREAWSGP